MSKSTSKGTVCIRAKIGGPTDRCFFSVVSLVAVMFVVSVELVVSVVSVISVF